MTLDQQRCWGVIAAAGTGSRMGSDVPKQYLALQNAPVLEHSLRALLDCPRIEGVCVALHARDDRATELEILADPRVITTTGAAQRYGSVLAGIEALEGVAKELDWVLVHDAARPCLRSEDVASLIDALIDSEAGGLLAEPVVDTLKRDDGRGCISATVGREGLWRAQTPQMFPLGLLRDALRKAQDESRLPTDEAMAMEWAGHSVRLVEGPRYNLKVTVPDDLALAAFYLARFTER